MELIQIPSHLMTTGLPAIEPISKLELELLAGYRRLSSDDRERILSVLHAMVSIKDANQMAWPVNT